MFKELLSKINKSLKVNEQQDFIELIRKSDAHVKNMDLHRCEIIGQTIDNVHFTQNSFRGAFIIDSIFINCSFEQCSFITTNIVNSKFINCRFQKCIYYAAFLENNIEENCLFKTCYTDRSFFNNVNNLLWLYEHSEDKSTG